MQADQGAGGSQDDDGWVARGQLPNERRDVQVTTYVLLHVSAVLALVLALLKRMSPPSPILATSNFAGGLYELRSTSLLVPCLTAIAQVRHLAVTCKGCN